MRKTGLFHTLLAMALVACVAAPAAQADTIRLKNGSVIKGKVTSFADEQFVVMLDSGSGRSMSKAMIYIADVAKIDFEGSPAIASDTSSASSDSTASTPRDNTSTSSGEDGSPARNVASRDTGKETAAPPVDPRLNKSNTGRNRTKEVKPPDTTGDDPTATKEPEVKQPEKTGAEKTGEDGAGESAARKPLPGARTVNVDISAKRDWTSSGVIVKRGDRVRITATGTITVDPAGQTSGPEGIDLSDSRKLMTEKPTGGLIGVIGADNDDFIFVGRAFEFTATRDGLLFLSVNEGTLTDNSGAFKAVIEIQAARAAGRQ